MDILVWRRDVKPKLTKNPIKIAIAALMIYFMFIPLLFLDMTLFMYQSVYFRMLDIPRIHRSNYLIIDRHRLSTLNLAQKLNCVYCGYANGVTAYAKAVANQTEVYSCAIKHDTKRYGQEHQDEFFEYGEYR